MFEYEKNVIKMFDAEGSDAADRDKEDFLWFTFMETKKEIKAELDSETLSEHKINKIKLLIEKLEFLAEELL